MGHARSLLTFPLFGWQVSFTSKLGGNVTPWVRQIGLGVLELPSSLWFFNSESKPETRVLMSLPQLAGWLSVWGKPGLLRAARMRACAGLAALEKVGRGFVTGGWLFFLNRMYLQCFLGTAVWSPVCGREMRCPGGVYYYREPVNKGFEKITFTHQ